MSLRHSHHRRRRPSVEWHQTHKIDRLWIDDIFVRENLIVISCERYLAIYRTGWWVLMLGAHNLCADTMCLLHITRLSHSACVTVWHRSEINTTQFGGFGLDFFFHLLLSLKRTDGKHRDRHSSKWEMWACFEEGEWEICTNIIFGMLGMWMKEMAERGTHWLGWVGWLVCRFVCLLADGAFNGRVVSQSHILCGSDQCITSSGVLLDILSQVWLADELPTRL